MGVNIVKLARDVTSLHLLTLTAQLRTSQITVILSADLTCLFLNAFEEGNDASQRSPGQVSFLYLASSVSERRGPKKDESALRVGRQSWRSRCLKRLIAMGQIRTNELKTPSLSAGAAQSH